MHVTELHQRAVESFVARLDALADQSWTAPTPCPEWDVRALVNHIVYEDLWTVPLMEGATLEEVGDRYEGDLLGGDPVATARAAAEAATMAAASGIVAGRTVHLSAGDTAAEEYAYQLAADHVIHGWDLAAATGADRALDADLVDALSAWFADRRASYRASGVIGDPPSDPAAAGGPQDRLLLSFGRDPRWAP